jgi:hypothetical protein
MSVKQPRPELIRNVIAECISPRMWAELAALAAFIFVVGVIVS